MRIRYKKWARPELEASKFYEDEPEKWKGRWSHEGLLQDSRNLQAVRNRRGFSAVLWAAGGDSAGQRRKRIPPLQPERHVQIEHYPGSAEPGVFHEADQGIPGRPECGEDPGTADAGADADPAAAGRTGSEGRGPEAEPSETGKRRRDTAGGIPDQAAAGQKLRAAEPAHHPGWRNGFCH